MSRPPVFAAIAVFCIASLVPGDDARACNVPVARYALQWWNPDPYRALVVWGPDGSAGQSALIESLRGIERASGSFPCLLIEEIAADVLAARHPDWAAGMAGKPPPHLLLLYPAQPGDPSPVLAWQAPFTAGTVTKLAASPKREELARRLLAGESAVWIALRSGHADADASAVARLRVSLEKMEEELELPADPLEGLTPEQAAVAARFADQLRIAFSVLELGRDDPGEEAFWSMLTRIDPAAAPEREPVFIPVFGRGRALLALPASEASEDAIAEICGFLTGPCSCQVKDSNPGVDILLPVHWDAALGDAGDPSTQLLPLVVPDPQVAAAPPPAPLIPPSAPPTTAAVIPAWAHTVLFVVAGLLLAAILGSVLLLRPRRNPPGRRRWEQSD